MKVTLHFDFTSYDCLADEYMVKVTCPWGAHASSEPKIPSEAIFLLEMVKSRIDLMRTLASAHADIERELAKWTGETV